MIVLENAGKAFNDKWAVRGLDIRARKRERSSAFSARMPPGKTTTIKMMTGICYEPTEGRDTDQRVRYSRRADKGKISVFGYVPDKAFLYEKLRGREFLKFIASLHGIAKDAALRRIDEACRLFRHKGD